MKRAIFLLLIILFFCVHVKAEGECTKYVDKNSIGGSCNDNNPGTISQPWCSLTKASQGAVAGDVVCVRRGVYSGSIAPANSGAAGNYITFKAIDEDSCFGAPYDYLSAAPVCGVILDKGIVNLFAKKYIHIEGFEIRDTIGNAIYCQEWGMGSVSNIEIVNNYIHNITSDYAAVSCRNVINFTIENNYIKDIYGGAAGIGITGAPDKSAKNAVIKGNTILHTSCDGMRVQGNNITIENNVMGNSFDSDCHQDGIEVYGPNDGLIIKNNKIYDFTQNIYISAENKDALNLHIRNVKILGNIIWCDQYCAQGNDAPGLAIGSNMSGVYNISIEGNTLYNVWNIITDSYTRIPSNRIENVVIRNNIFHKGPAKSGIDFDIRSSELEEDYNLYYNPYGLFDYPNPGSNSLINVNPMLVDLTNFDLHISENSPAIDAGTNIGLNVDFDGNLRPQAQGFDIGAYEFNGEFQAECESNSDCDNGIFCDGEEVCISGIGCAPGENPCNDDVSCSMNFCNEVTDVCEITLDDDLCLPLPNECSSGICTNGGCSYSPAGCGRLIENIAVSTGKTYILDDDMDINDKLYIDRNYKFVNVPQEYIGKNYILTSNDDRWVISNEHLTFSISRASSILVGYDDNPGSALPLWLEDWEDTGEVIASDISGEPNFRVYKKDFDAGQVVLGGPDNYGRTNYFVIAAPRCISQDELNFEIQKFYAGGLDISEISSRIEEYIICN